MRIMLDTNVVISMIFSLGYVGQRLGNAGRSWQSLCFT